MTEYAYEQKIFDESETVQIPESAVGHEISTWDPDGEESGFVSVEYLIPVYELD